MPYKWKNEVDKKEIRAIKEKEKSIGHRINLSL